MEDDILDTAGELAGAAVIAVGAGGVAATIVDYWATKVEKERQKREAESECPGCAR